MPFSGTPSALIKNMKVGMPFSGTPSALIKNMKVGMPFSGRDLISHACALNLSVNHIDLTPLVLHKPAQKWTTEDLTHKVLKSPPLSFPKPL